jgi:hypothetical protein
MNRLQQLRGHFSGYGYLVLVFLALLLSLEIVLAVTRRDPGYMYGFGLGVVFTTYVREAAQDYLDQKRRRERERERV